MKPGIAALLIIVLLLLAAGAYAVVYQFNANDSESVLNEVNRDAEIPVDNVSTSDDSVSGNISVTTESETTSPQQAIVDNTEQTTQQANEEVQEPELRFMAVGDIMLGRGVGMRLQKAGDYKKAFEKVSDYFSMGDVLFANLETPLTSSTHGLDKKRKIVLKGNPEAVSALTSAGFNLISLSNNHMMDYYEKGLQDTMELLSKNGIIYAGGGKDIEDARKLAIKEVNGIKVGLLAYTDMAELTFAGDPYLSFAAGTEKSGVVPRKYETIKEDILKARGQVDILAISLHWGVEESFTITQDQVEFAHNLIDDGADVILGHHPHQFQGMEMYKGKPIMYSMGNFLFDQNDSENMESFIIDMRYKGKELVEFAAIPVRILDKSYVEIQTGESAANILDRQSKLCLQLGTNAVTDKDRLVFK